MAEPIIYTIAGAVLGSGVAGLTWAIAKRVYSDSGHRESGDRRSMHKESAKARA